MPPELIAQILSFASPIIAGLMRQYFDRTGRLPTDEEMQAELTRNAAQVLADGAAWKAEHPEDN